MQEKMLCGEGEQWASGGVAVSPAQAELVARAMAGDRAAFDELAQQYRRRATAVAIHLLGDLHGAQDVVQESFLAAFERIHTLRDPARFASWFHCILRRKCLRYRARRSADASLDDVPEPVAREGDGRTRELLEEILPALNSLPLAFREVLAARYLSEMSYEEIAQMLGISQSAVRVRCFRAKVRLRELLRRKGIGAPRGGMSP